MFLRDGGIKVATVYTVSAITLFFLTFLSLLRGVIGPTAPDRVAAINVVGTKTMVIISLVSFLYDQEFFLDVALVYAMIAFVLTIAVSKYMERGALD